MRMNDLKEMVIMFLAAKTVNKTTNDIKDIIYMFRYGWSLYIYSSNYVHLRINDRDLQGLFLFILRIFNKGSYENKF